MEHTHRIREAADDDLPRILELIALHAAFEGSMAPPRATREGLLALLRCEPPRLFCLVATSAGEVVAYATFAREVATWDSREYVHLDCLFVVEAWRGRGVGASLMREVRQCASAQGCSEIQWQTPSDNREAIEFYRHIGATDKPKQRFFWGAR